MTLRSVPVGPAGLVGWCHSCGTIQLGDDARLLAPEWADGERYYCCVVCDDEPWGLGVWVVEAPRPVDRLRAVARVVDWQPVMGSGWAGQDDDGE